MKSNIFLPLFILFFFTLKSWAQNPCGVKAILSPNNKDTIVRSPTVVLFQSASINATSYKVIIDLYDYGINNPVNWQLQPGLTTVKLVAYNGNCTDTSVVYYFYPGNFPTVTDNARRLYGQASRDQYLNDLITHSSGDYILTGSKAYWALTNENPEGLLMRIKKEGCVRWAKKLSGNFKGDITLVKEAADNGVFIKAEVDYKKYIVKLNSSGNILWARSIKQEGDIDFPNTEMEALPDGGLVAVGSTADNKTFNVIRLDNSGNMVWQNKYAFGLNVSYTQMFHNLLYKQDYIYIGGELSLNDNSEQISCFTKLDINTGQVVWMKKYASSSGDFNWLNMIDDGNSIAVAIIGGTGVANFSGIGGIMRLDTAGQVKSASLWGEYYASNALSSAYGTTGAALTKSGNTFYLLSNLIATLSLQPYFSVGYKLIKIDSSYNASWVEGDHGAGVKMFQHNAKAPNDAVALGGSEVGVALSPNYLATLLSLKIVDSSGSKKDADCAFGRSSFTQFPLSMAIQNINASAITASCINTPANLTLKPFYPEMRFKCPDYVDSCSFLKITGTKSVCNLSNTYTYKAHKNRACGQPTQWEIPQDVNIISQTDSSVTVRFPAFKQYVIYGTNPLSCNIVQDSIVIVAASNTAPLNLGPDKEICPKNKITVHAGPHFYTYSWSDGSKDSILLVSEPGEYWVEVTDSCGNISRDTINILPAPPIPFSVGDDRFKCNNDTLELRAPPGFINYEWSPAYNIVGEHSQVATVNPVVNTTYTIKAEKTPGCFAYDSIKVSVFTSPVINLGDNVSFCSGDSAVFNAGSGFSHYEWSNGRTTSSIAATTPGEYSVVAITAQGCKSVGSVKILNVYDLPQPFLDQSPVLCSGSERVLTPGNNFKSYLWSTGSQAPAINIKDTGFYTVSVTDINECSASAGVLINKISPLPAHFLSADTSICSYGSITLIPNRDFENYLWNTGYAQKSITITRPGTYILEVKDSQGCSGKDTIIVKQKDCITGLYVPNTFTPNGDGKNDELRPMLFGNIKNFQFVMYNRWGLVVFSSRIPSKGWDGKLSGKLQDSQIFVWVCNYQLEGGEMKSEQGTVLLLR